MSPAEDALLLLRLAARHLGSLRGTLDPATFAEEDWGFLAQQTLEKLLKALLVLHCRSHSAAIRCNVCCRSSPAAAKPWASLQNYWSSMTSRCWPAMTPSPVRSTSSGRRAARRLPHNRSLASHKGTRAAAASGP